MWKSVDVIHMADTTLLTAHAPPDNEPCVILPIQEDATVSVARYSILDNTCGKKSEQQTYRLSL